MMSVRLFSAVAIRAEILSIVAEFDSPGRCEVETKFDLNPAVASRILDGEAFDVGITNPWYVSDLIDRGIVSAQRHAAFGRVPLAIGIHERDAGPARVSEAEIRDLLLNAVSIAYTGDGTSGKTFLAVADRLDIANVIAGKSVAMGAGEPVKAVAAGQVQLCAAPLTTIIAAGVAPAAILPEDLGGNIDMSIFLSKNAESNPVANMLFDFLVSKDRVAFLRSRGVMRFEMV